MIFSTAAILFLFVLFTGVGLVFPWASYRKEQNIFNLLANFWIGWALTIGGLQIWHFFLPVNPWAFAIIALVSIFGWLRNGRTVLRQAQTWNRSTALVLAGIACVPAAMLANHVMFTVPYSDHGLYHLQSVTWISRFAIVPGLGNVHHRLAFNNANFLYASLLNWGPLQERAYFVNNTLLGWVMILTCGAGFYGLFKSQARSIQPHNLFYALFLPVSFNHLSTTHLPGYSPDVPNFILQVILAGELLRLVDTQPEQPYYRSQAFFMALLVAVGVTIKLAFAAFGLLILLALLILWIRRFGFNKTLVFTLIRDWVLIGSALLIPWLIRNVVLSGYLLYPSMVISFPVPWKIPEALVAPIAPIIADWARTVSNSFPYTADLTWFSNWWNRFPFLIRQTFIFTLIITCFDGLLFLALSLLKPAKPIKPDLSSVCLWCIAALSLVYWFLMAPDYRFSGAAFWILLASAIIFGYQVIARTWQIQSTALLVSSILLALTLWLSPNHFSNNLSRKWMFYPPPESELAEQAQSIETMITRVTNSGLEVHMPPPPSDNCWNLPLPCVPPADYTAKLQLIEPGNMQKGFYLPGW